MKNKRKISKLEFFIRFVLFNAGLFLGAYGLLYLYFNKSNNIFFIIGDVFIGLMFFFSSYVLLGTLFEEKYVEWCNKKTPLYMPDEDQLHDFLWNPLMIMAMIPITMMLFFMPMLYVLNLELFVNVVMVCLGIATVCAFVLIIKIIRIGLGFLLRAFVAFVIFLFVWGGIVTLFGIIFG